jgi:hypothetical protein
MNAVSNVNPYGRVRLHKGELFHALGYKPHAAQATVHACKARRRVMACGVRFGKSTVGVFEAIAALLEPRESGRGWLCAPTFDLTTRIFRHVVDLLHHHFPKRVIRFDARERLIVVANFGGGTTELRAKSTDKPVSLLGEALDFVIIDEAAKVREDVWSEHIAPRLLDRNGWALFLSTPDGGGWFYKEFRRAQKKKDPDYAGWQFPTSTNPHISSELIEAERKRLAPDVFRAQYLAEFVDVPIEQCETCRGPRPDAPCCIDLHNDEQPLRCPDCNGYVGKDGLTRVQLWPNGETYTMILVIEDGPQFKNAYRGPVTRTGEAKASDKQRVVIIHGSDGDEPVPLPEADGAVS